MADFIIIYQSNLIFSYFAIRFEILMISLLSFIGTPIFLEISSGDWQANSSDPLNSINSFSIVLAPIPLFLIKEIPTLLYFFCHAERIQQIDEPHP